MNGLTFKEKRIKIMKNYPFECSVTNLPPNIKCAYRALTRVEMNDHVGKHQHSLNTHRRTKARYYEVSIHQPKSTEE